MKGIRKYIKFLGATALAIMIAISPLCLVEVSAGASDYMIDRSSFGEELDATTWNAPNGDVYAQDGKIIFDENTEDGTRLITSRAIRASKYNEELFRAEYTLKLDEFEDGSQFLVLFGLESLEAYYNEEDNLALTLENSNGLQASMVAFNDLGNAVAITEPKAVGSIGQELKISVQAGADNHLNLQVNGSTVFDGSAEQNLAGRLGFALTGMVQAQISDVTIVSHRYDNPENANIVEDFESGTMNVNTLNSLMRSSNGYFPTGLNVQDYNGNKVLMFQNVGTGYVATTYQYSNFEISFDMPYVLYRSYGRDDGTFLKTTNSGLVLSFGDDNSEADALMYDYSPEAIVLSNTSISRLKAPEMTVNLEEQHPSFYSEKDSVGYSVKVRVEDANVTVYAKALASEEFTEVLSYSLNNVTPLGYIHIWSKETSNVAIDNLVITNLDRDPNLVEADYKEGFLPEVEDWKYEEFPVKYLPAQENTEDKGFNWTLVGIIEMVVGVVIAVASILYVSLKRKSAKKGSV